MPKVKRKIFRIITWGGAGDVLLLTPVLKTLKEEFYNCKIIIYGSSSAMEIYKNNPYIDRLTTFSFYKNPVFAVQYFFKLTKFYRTNFQWIPLSYIYNVSVPYIIADIFNVTLKDKKVQVYLTAKEEQRARNFLNQYKNSVIIHVTSKCSVNHMWQHKKWDQLVAEMPDYTFIQVGLESEQAVKGAIDLRGKTSMREAMALIKYTNYFVGIESFFAHVTNAFDTPGVVMFGDSSPVFWGHDNNINLYKSLPCSPCYDLLGGKKCPYGNECMSLITVDEVKKSIMKLQESIV